jgi:hypothetical protein
MDLIRFIFYMGVIHIVFSSLWKFIATLASSMLQRVGISKDYSFLAFKAIGYYIVVSVAALVTWAEMQQVSAFAGVLIAAAGTFIIYTTIAGNLERNRWRAVMNFERKRVQVMRFDGYMLVGSLLLFLTTLAMPQIADHPVNAGFRALIDAIYNSWFIGWIVKIGAIFYLVHILFKGMRATDYVMQSLFGVPKTKLASDAPANPPFGRRGLDDQDGFTPYEEIEEVEVEE